MTLHLIIPAPPKALHPNSRPHWRAKAAATKKYRRAVGMLAMEQLGRVEPWKSATCYATFYVRDKRRRDADNALASLKAAFDALRDAGVIEDDSGLSHAPVRFIVNRDRAGTVDLVLNQEAAA